MVFMNKHVNYTGTGLGILWRVWIGTILVFITLGLYFPWYINGLIRYVAQHAEVNGRPNSVVFTGTGARMFLQHILWELLLIITLGFAWPWVFNSFCRYIVEHIEPSGGQLN